MVASATVLSLFPEGLGSKGVVAATRFEEVWRLWPNKSKKPLARAKYNAILAGCKTRTMDRDSGQFVEIELIASEEEIVKGIKAYLDSLIDRKTFKMKDDGKYVPMLSTFLNGGRYEDFN